MKKILSMILILGIVLSAVPVLANIDYEFCYGEYSPYGGVVSGNADVRKEENSRYYVDADMYTVFTFNDILDSLSVSYSTGAKDDGIFNSYFDFSHDLYKENKVFTSDACTVNYTVGERKKVETWYNQTRQENVYVETDEPFYYMNEGVSIRFNKPGTYHINADYAGYRNMDQFEDFNSYAKENGYPYVFFEVHVRESQQMENIDGVFAYDENLISVSGITGYDESRQVLYDNRVAICAAPVVFEAKTDLTNLVITPLEQINGQWQEVDIMSGIVEEFIDGKWVVNMEESTTAHYDSHFGPVKKGEKIEITKPGMYEMWAEASQDKYTGLTLKEVEELKNN